MPSFTTNTPFHASIDAAAEREAESIEFMQQELGVGQPKTRLEVEREYRAEALRRGLPLAAVRYCYQRRNAVRAWLKIIDRYATGARPEKQYFRWNTRTDRQARNLRKLANGGRLIHPGVAARASAALAKLRDAKLEPGALMDLPFIAAQFGLAERTLYRAASKGRLKTITVHTARIGQPTKLVPLTALREYVEAHTPIAS
jgi:hypothetical protein